MNWSVCLGNWCCLSKFLGVCLIVQVAYVCVCVCVCMCDFVRV